MRRAALLYNPRAGAHRTKRLEAIRAALAMGGWEISFHATTGPDDCRAHARQAVADRLDALFVLGGDGTLRIAAEAVSGSGLALATLPGGTTNVVALALGLPFDPVAAARRLAHATARTIDLGRAGADGFLMQLSGGLDARVLAAIDPRQKRRWGKGAIAWTGLREWLRYDFPRFALEVDGERLETTGFVVANLAEYGGRLRIVPAARADDGRLDLLLFRGRRRRDALGFALALARGRHLARPDVEVRAISRLSVLGPPGAPLQIDGDPISPPLPLAVTLERAAVRLLVPEPVD